MRNCLLINPAQFSLEKLEFFQNNLHFQVSEFTDVSIKLLESKAIKYFIVAFRGEVTESVLLLIKQCKLIFPSLIIILISDSNSQVKFQDFGVDHIIYFKNSYSKLESDLITIAWHYESKGIDSFPVIQIKDLIFNPNSKLVSRAGIPIILSKKEFELLEFLIHNKGTVVSRLTILEVVWGYNSDSFSNTVDVHFTKLRKKIDTNFEAKYLHTVHCVGYKFDPEIQQQLL